MCKGHFIELVFMIQFQQLIWKYLFFEAPYVKVYLVSGKKCLAKAKTATARRTLDPLYQQQLTFREPFQGCILQVK